MSALYDTIGKTYAEYRRADLRIMAAIDTALGDAASVISIGSGTGSYEPTTRRVAAVEPSRVMIKQRPSGAAPVAQAVAEHLPFADSAFDAALAVLTVHHWPDPTAGFAEMKRVARRQIVLTWDPAVFRQFWLVDEYLPAIITQEAGLATLDAVCAGLDVVEVRALPVPRDGTDGFCGAYWRRPQHYLDPGARAAISAISLLDQREVDRAMLRLEHDLSDGTWHERHTDLAALTELDLGYRLVIAGDT